MPSDFQQFARHSADALASLTADGRILFANPRFVGLFAQDGGGPADCLDRLQLSPEVIALLLDHLRMVHQSGAENEFSIQSGICGADEVFDCRIVPVIRSGHDAGLILELKGPKAPAIGDRQGHPAAVTPCREGDNFFRVLDKFPAFVYMQRKDYTVAYANEKVRDLYGETESRLCYEVFAGRSTPCPVCPTFEVFDIGRSIEWEFVDEKNRTFRIYDYPFAAETGEPLVMELGIDVTDLKRVEKELFQAQKLRAIGVLAAGLAHDLNNNLVPIIFNIDHAVARISDPDAAEPLSEALQAAYRAARLVEQVLEYSRQQAVSRAPLHLVPLIEASLSAFRRTLNADIRLNARLDAAHDCISANPAQMQQLISNLLRNAEQAMPDGGTISISLQDNDDHDDDGAGDFFPHTESDMGALRLTIRDTGSGIAAENVEQIFEPFFTTKKSRGGTGMGLAVVYSIVSGSRGTIRVESEPGKGSTFILDFPKSVRPATAPAAQPCAAPGERQRLLVVDDDPGALSAMARTLRQARFEVETAVNAEDGFCKFARDPGRFGLILADQSMPGTSGIEMSAKMRALDKKARIIICTGYVQPALEKSARRQGILDFAIKPMSPAALVELVRRYCA
ncbi:PAS domain-containing hybrid sensor histidine kinase/response regulator [Desulfosarcina ovata]|uniref:histidine kinase n=1 Tax=Desulfosarcina ovata subsp. ovata TaxID=2752305 RepID=A0A5K8AFF2_9BACT|nr:PAS domain-containing hybrid sensor histidine kinase/response regulator [Desulfosarcina ovata]BBO91246.1 hypothetical protein DSCOOX_44260 [Desulfosarcina ovata subsp. ovata]